MDGQGTGIEYRIGGKVDERYLDGWTKKRVREGKEKGGLKQGSGEEKQEGCRSNYGLLSLLPCPDPRQETLSGAGRAETIVQAAAPAGVNGRFRAAKLANKGKGREAAAEDTATDLNTSS